FLPPRPLSFLAISVLLYFNLEFSKRTVTAQAEHIHEVLDVSPLVFIEAFEGFWAFVSGDGDRLPHYFRGDAVDHIELLFYKFCNKAIVAIHTERFPIFR